MMKAVYARYILRFKEPAVTSRQTMTVKETYFVKLEDEHGCAIGECGLFRGLGCDDIPGYEQRLAMVCRDLSHGVMPDMADVPSIRFGVETALACLEHGNPWRVNDTGWVDGLIRMPINGLVWMGSKREMLERIDRKLDAGFRCIKIKVGAIGFDDELDLLRHVRKRYRPEELTLRLDANGGFATEDVMECLKRLSDFSVHSIEQPIKAGQYEAMARICDESPIPIALDEELIGLNRVADKAAMLDAVKPAFVILKPSLCGGLTGTREWKRLADERGIGSWITSALESSVGLNAVSQLACELYGDSVFPQGLGTGGLYVNNIDSPLRQCEDYLTYNTSLAWSIPVLQWNIP